MMVEQQAAVVAWPESDSNVNDSIPLAASASTVESGESSVVAPKPSAVRRSGRLQYVRRHRSTARPGLNPPSSQRMAKTQPTTKPIDHKMGDTDIVSKPSSPRRAHGSKPQQQDLYVSEMGQVETANEQTSDDPQPPERVAPVVIPVEPAEEKKVDDDAVPMGETLQRGNEEPNAVHTHEGNDVKPILDDRLFDYAKQNTDEYYNGVASSSIDAHPVNTNPSRSGVTRTIAAVPSVAEGEEEDPSVKILQNFSSISRSSSHSSVMKTKVYHRPHTNETVLAGTVPEDPDTQSIASEGNSTATPADVYMQKRARAMARRSSRSRKKKASIRKARSREGESRNSNQTLGRVVSHAFDKMLGFGLNDEDGYSSEESENIISDLFFSTFGCAVPAGVQPVKTNDDYDDETVETHNTGKSSEVSSVRHVRSNSGMSQSVMTGISSVFSFETTEELADFQEKKAAAAMQQKKDRATSTKTTGNFKIPDVSDPSSPPNAHADDHHTADGTSSVKSGTSQQRMYTKNLYSNVTESDFAPVDLLSETDTIIEEANKIKTQLLKSANSKVDEVFTSIQTLLSGNETNDEITLNGNVEGTFDSVDETNTLSTSGYDTNTLSTSGGYSESLIQSNMSNVSEPLGVIKENDAETSGFLTTNKETPAVEEDSGFVDRFEVNVFETVLPTESSIEGKTGVDSTPEVVEAKGPDRPSPIEEPVSTDLVITDVSPEIKKDDIENEQDSLTDVLKESDVKDVDGTPSKKSFSSTSIQARIKALEEGTNLELTDTSMAASEKNGHESSFNESSLLEASMTSDRTPDQATPATPVRNDSLSKVPGTPQKKKKKKKGGLKGFIRRSFSKNKKEKLSPSKSQSPSSNRKNSQIPASPRTVPVVKVSTVSESAATDKLPPGSPSNESLGEEKRTPDTVDFNPSPKAKSSSEMAMHAVAEPASDQSVDWVDFDNATKLIDPIARPTTPDVELSGIRHTPKTSNTGIEATTEPKNVSALKGIGEMMSAPETKLRQKDASFQSTNTDNTFDITFETTGGEYGNNHVDTAKGVVSTKSFDESKEISFDDFDENFDFSTSDSKWESFGDAQDVGASAFRAKLGTTKASPQKVSDFPEC